MGFLGVYRAIYDYAPSAEGELAIGEGDLLYLLDKNDDDGWWKAKRKAGTDEEDEPEGLIPKNYVEAVSAWSSPLHAPSARATPIVVLLISSAPSRLPRSTMPMPSTSILARPTRNCLFLRMPSLRYLTTLILTGSLPASTTNMDLCRPTTSTLRRQTLTSAHHRPRHPRLCPCGPNLLLWTQRRAY